MLKTLAAALVILFPAAAAGADGGDPKVWITQCVYGARDQIVGVSPTPGTDVHNGGQIDGFDECTSWTSKHCSGQRFCAFPVGSQLLGGRDPAPGLAKHVRLIYQCAEERPTPVHFDVLWAVEGADAALDCRLRPTGE